MKTYLLTLSQWYAVTKDPDWDDWISSSCLILQSCCMNWDKPQKQTEDSQTPVWFTIHDHVLPDHPFLPLLSRRAQVGRWFSFGKRLWFTESQTVLVIPFLLTVIFTDFYSSYTGCNRRNGPDFGRVFLRSYNTDITENTYIQSSMFTEVLAREVWNFDSYYSLIDYKIHIETGRNMWFL